MTFDHRRFLAAGAKVILPSKLTPSCDRLAIANTVLETFCREFRFSRDGYLKIHWKDWRGTPIEKRWSSAPNFYPPFHRQMGCGGTQITAITQLARWIQDRPVLPLSTWQYWGSDTVRLWKDDELRAKALTILQESDYPWTPVCVFCGKDLSGKSWDWHYKPNEGPGCWDKSQCETRR